MSWVTMTTVEPIEPQTSFDQILHLQAGQGVERGERLVEQEHLRVRR